MINPEYEMLTDSAMTAACLEIMEREGCTTEELTNDELATAVLDRFLEIADERFKRLGL